MEKLSRITEQEKVENLYGSDELSDELNLIIQKINDIIDWINQLHPPR